MLNLSIKRMIFDPTSKPVKNAALIIPNQNDGAFKYSFTKAIIIAAIHTAWPNDAMKVFQFKY